MGYKTKKQQINKQNEETNQNKLIFTDNRMMVKRLRRQERMKRVKGFKYMVTDGDQTSGGELTTGYTGVGL